MPAETSNSNKIRTFIAIEIQDKAILENIKMVQDDLGVVNGKIKFVELENIHLTLKFIGDTSLADAKKIYQILDGIKTIPEDGIEVRLKGLSVFNRRRPRVLWSHLIDETGTIEKTYKEIESALEQELGIKKEKRPFKSHVTIARIKFVRDLDGFYKVLDKHKDKLLGSQRVFGFKFKKSTLTPRGPIYSDITFD
ncbi:MAG: RNA 2',3'-cyclic phosphodiesterase [Promethearchaeota archaeon]